jgi:hypothetical protein
MDQDQREANEEQEAEGGWAEVEEKAGQEEIGRVPDLEASVYVRIVEKRFRIRPAFRAIKLSVQNAVQRWYDNKSVFLKKSDLENTLMECKRVL